MIAVVIETLVEEDINSLYDGYEIMSLSDPIGHLEYYYYIFNSQNSQ